jgi:dynein heavy chain 2, cytosolic
MVLIPSGLMYYEREEKELGMLLFPEILNNIARIDRVLSRQVADREEEGRGGGGLTMMMMMMMMMMTKKTRMVADDD